MSPPTDLGPDLSQSEISGISHAPPLPHHHHVVTEAGLLHATQSLLYIIVTAVFILTFIAQPFRIPSESMEPTLLVGDFLLVDKQASGLPDPSGLLPSTGIRRGDIIVFHYPIDPAIHLVKRVVALPGDHLRLRSGHLFINGHPMAEPYAIFRPGAPDAFRDNFPRLQNADPDINAAWWIRMRNLIDDGELIVPTGNFFVLGDNRNDSEDSRYWGFVPLDSIVGRPFLIYFSLQQPSDTAPAPSHSPLSALADFARWSRTLQVVR